MRGPPKKTIHILFPPDDQPALKKLCIEQLGAERIIFKRSQLEHDELGPSSFNGGDDENFDMVNFEAMLGPPYVFVVFKNVHMATQAGARISERWPKAVVDFARHDWVHTFENLGAVNGVTGLPENIGQPTKVLEVATLGVLSWQELDNLLLEYEDYENVEVCCFL
jgi:hypothetical protein